MQVLPTYLELEFKNFMLWASAPVIVPFAERRARDSNSVFFYSTGAQSDLPPAAACDDDDSAKTAPVESNASPSHSISHSPSIAASRASTPDPSAVASSDDLPADAFPSRPSLQYRELDKPVLGQGVKAQKLVDSIDIRTEPPTRFPTKKNTAVLIQHPHSFRQDTDPRTARREMLVRTKSYSGDDYSTGSSGSVTRGIVVSDVWTDDVEMYTGYEYCTGMKMCPRFVSDYDPEDENEKNEEKKHIARVKHLNEQMKIEELLPFSTTIT
jgi:hypothetical protein